VVEDYGIMKKLWDLDLQRMSIAERMKIKILLQLSPFLIFLSVTIRKRKIALRFIEKRMKRLDKVQSQVLSGVDCDHVWGWITIGFSRSVCLYARVRNE